MLKPNQNFKGLYGIDEWFTDFHQCPTNTNIFLLKPDSSLESGFIQDGLIHAPTYKEIYNFNECMAWAFKEDEYH